MNIRRIFVEYDAQSSVITQHVLQQYPSLPVHYINHYKDIFNVSGQDFQWQKRHTSLILAYDHGQLLYEVSQRIDSWNSENAYYTIPILNCIYNCDYCILQGIYPSAHIVFFVNIEDAHQAIKKRAHELAQKKEHMFISISYSSDMLAFEQIYPYVASWIQFVETLDNVTLEVRTKTDFFHAISYISPTPKNTTLVWSIAPDRLIKRYESGCASLSARLFVIKKALDAQWRVRLCFDPIFHYDGWYDEYAACIQQVWNVLAASSMSIEQVSFGMLRAGMKAYKKIQAMHPRSPLMHLPLEHNTKLGVVSFSPEQEREVYAMMYEHIGRYVAQENICFVHG